MNSFIYSMCTLHFSISIAVGASFFFDVFFITEFMFGRFFPFIMPMYAVSCIFLRYLISLKINILFRNYSIFGTLLGLSVVILGYARFYVENAGFAGNCDVQLSQLDALFFSITTFTTLGYGNILPCESARLISSSQALIGFLFVPLILSFFVQRFEYQDRM